ncbi:DUF3857 domain-containing protein [Halpernia frigidisoli]|uniref:DUF3857 domain-containing protein n=1 Tax=Halpernia frigidisoli TaxID=1125876 RepID=A0A1I3GGG0_9FLAO|nr:DUF3857 domain-containing protein [Halpernia frigidisoli]SFI22549.1 protein of unknown function [Halpernia frigidisoli]
MYRRLYILPFFLPLFTLAQNFSIASISDSLRKNAYAVIRNHTENYTVNSVKDMDITEETTISILSSSGENFSVIGIPYNPTTRVSDIKVIIYDEDGKEVKKFSKKDFSDVSNNPSNALYVDDRVLFLKPVVGKYPYTLKYSFTTSTSNTAFLNFRPLNKYNLAVEKSQITFNNKSGIQLNSKIYDTFLAKVSKSEVAGMSQYTYQNIPALEEETLAPSIDVLVPHVDFAMQKFSLARREGDNTSWNSFGKWYYNDLLMPVSQITPEIQKEVNDLNLTGTTAEKVKKLYQYMQSKTHYIFVAMGIGGWQPMVADDVRKKGYGDCKALTNYMRTLLQAAGIKAYYCVINDNESAKSFDPDFTEIAGNHAILMIPTEKEPIWLENTSQNVAFNHLMYTSNYRNVLAVKEDGIDLIKTPVYKPEDSKEILNSKIKINLDNSINTDSKFSFTGGQYDQNMGLLFKDNSDLKESLKNRHGNLHIENLNVENLFNNRDNAEINYELKFTASDFSKKLGDDIFFRVMPFYSSTMLSSDPDRKLPFENSFPFQDDYSVEFEIPAGYKFSEMPKDQDLKSEFGAYSISFKNENGKLMVHRILTINRGNYPKEKYQNYVDFRKKTSSLDNTKVLITKL